MAKIKTKKNASEALDQDPTNSVSSVTSKARDVTKSGRSISNQMSTT